MSGEARGSDSVLLSQLRITGCLQRDLRAFKNEKCFSFLFIFPKNRIKLLSGYWIHIAFTESRTGFLTVNLIHKDTATWNNKYEVLGESISMPLLNSSYLIQHMRSPFSYDPLRNFFFPTESYIHTCCICVLRNKQIYYKSR